MKLLALTIDGFRGIQRATIRFGEHDVLVGPIGPGKSTIIDALSFVFGRTRLVRDLTEHDFHGSCPEATSRIRIIATLGGFEGDDPGRDDAAEKAVAGKRLDELPQKKWPARTPLHALPSRSIWMIASKFPAPRATASAGIR